MIQTPPVMAKWESGGIAKTLALLDRLFGLASKCNIPISVGVYPWPQQLLYDSEES